MADNLSTFEDILQYYRRFKINSLISLNPNENIASSPKSSDLLVASFFDEEFENESINFEFVPNETSTQMIWKIYILILDKWTGTGNRSKND